MSCRVQYGIDNACGDILFPGGVDPDFFIGYVSDLGASFSLSQSGPISSISFQAYRGLVKFSGQKFSHVLSDEWAKGTNGNGYFLHRAIVKLITKSTQDDVEIQRLLQAQDAFLVGRNNDDQFFIYGASKGMTSVAGPLGSTGQNAGDDVANTVTLEGAEKTKPLRFLVTDAATTLAYLNARVI